MSEYKPEDLERQAAHVADVAKAYGWNDLNEITAHLLAGAQAMRDLEKAQERVKELETAFQKCNTELYWCAKQLESHGHAHRDGDSVDVALKLAAAALQVKP